MVLKLMLVLSSFHFFPAFSTGFSNASLSFVIL